MSNNKGVVVNKWILVSLVIIVAVLILGEIKRKPMETVQIPKTNNKETVKPSTLPEKASNSEGNLILVGTSQQTSEGRTAYEFKIINTQKKTESPLYETVADPGNLINIPLNSWSPDYKQVFVKTSGPGWENYYLFRANGEPYADGKKFIAVGDYWKEAKMNSRINKLTGWAGNDLLMIYTIKEDGSEGSAYWFVTSSRKFMQVREF